MGHLLPGLTVLLSCLSSSPTLPRVFPIISFNCQMFKIPLLILSRDRATFGNVACPYFKAAIPSRHFLPLTRLFSSIRKSLFRAAWFSALGEVHGDTRISVDRLVNHFSRTFQARWTRGGRKGKRKWSDAR